MKHLFYLLALLPFFLSAQEDQKYLEGAVPVENEKVVFSKEIKVPSMNHRQIYEAALQWAEERFDSKRNTEERNCRVVFRNPEDGEIAATGKEYLVFSSTVLSLDRSQMSYQVLVYCSDHSCLIKLTNIRYEYNVSYQREPEKYAAEEWITDKYALRKGKLNRITGKFRRATIDFAEELFASATAAFGQSQSTVSTVAQESEAPQTVPAAKLIPALKAPEGYTLMAVNSIPSTLLNMLPSSNLAIKMADNNISDKDAVWKGLGNMFGKNIASVSVDAGSSFYKTVKDGEVYTLQFSVDNGVWMIIECSKQGETTDGDRKVIVGEVLHVWVK